MYRKVSLETFLNVFNVWIKLQVEELRRLKEIRNKASSAGREAKIDQFATERTRSYILETVERLNEELHKKPIQVQKEM